MVAVRRGLTPLRRLCAVCSRQSGQLHAVRVETYFSVEVVTIGFGCPAIP